MDTLKSFDGWYHSHKNKSNAEFQKLFREKYLAVVKELEDAKLELTKGQERILENYKEDLDKTIPILKNFWKALVELNKENIEIKTKWLSEPNCANPEFNRGYVACYMKYRSLIDGWFNQDVITKFRDWQF